MKCVWSINQNMCVPTGTRTPTQPRPMQEIDLSDCHEQKDIVSLTDFQGGETVYAVPTGPVTYCYQVATVASMMPAGIFQDPVNRNQQFTRAQMRMLIRRIRAPGGIANGGGGAPRPGRMGVEAKVSHVQIAFNSLHLQDGRFQMAYALSGIFIVGFCVLKHLPHNDKPVGYEEVHDEEI